jgi:hypothetical protein
MTPSMIGILFAILGNTVMLATIIFKAGAIVEKVSTCERRLDKIEDEPRGCAAEDCPLRSGV